MQNTRGLRAILSVSWVYELAERIAGSRRVRDWLVENVWKIGEGQTVVDVGCGPGSVLKHLPKDINYFGFDISAPYIRSAQSNFPDRGEFICCDAVKFFEEKRELEGKVDVVLTNAVLHHLDDQVAIDLLRVAHRLLKPGGRFVSIEATFLRHQRRSSQWLVAQDRGQNVRYECQWKKLISSVFPNYETSIITGLLRIPYTHIVIEAHK